MTAPSGQDPTRQSLPAGVTTFEVDSEGVIRMADFADAKTRAEYYEDVAESLTAEPGSLVEAMEQCPPLAWHVAGLFEVWLEEQESEITRLNQGTGEDLSRASALRARLDQLPEDYEEGAAEWVNTMTSEEYEQRLLPEIDKWFEEEPSWAYEGDYLPASRDAQGAAFLFFDDMTFENRRTLGVKVIDGDMPGSSYRAAELRRDIDSANRAAADAGIPVRFRPLRTEG